MTSKASTARHGFRALLTSIVDYAGSKVGRALAVVTAAAVLEGAGVVFLLPLAETIFVGGDGTNSEVTSRLQRWFEFVGATTVFGQLAVLGIGFITLVGIRGLVLLRRDAELSSLSHGFVDHTRHRLFTMLAQADWPTIKRLQKAHLIDAMTTDVGRLGQTMHVLSRGLVTMALGLAYLAAAFFVSAVLGLLVLALVVLAIASASVGIRRSRRNGERLTRANRGVMEETTRFLEGLKTAKVVGAEGALARRFSDAIAATRALQVSFVFQQSRMRNLIQLVAAVAAVLVLLIGYQLLGLSGGELLVVAAIVLRLSPSLTSTLGSMQSLTHALPSFNAIRALEAEISEAGGDSVRLAAESGAVASFDPPAQLELLSCTAEVRNGRSKPLTLVRSGRIVIDPGMMVHISGPSGAGKSTLIELVAGLHLPGSGAVRYGGLQLSDVTRRSWQRHVSFAPQEPFIFSGSVRENLLWPNSTADEGAIWAALRKAEATQIVSRLPLQLEEPLLDGGARLSGGERQRLCLARALLRPARLLLLDEATSALDPALERRIVSALKADIGQSILLMICHSQSVSEFADVRVVVDHGHVRVE